MIGKPLYLPTPNICCNKALVQSDEDPVPVQTNKAKTDELKQASYLLICVHKFVTTNFQSYLLLTQRYQYMVAQSLSLHCRMRNLNILLPVSQTISNEPE